MKFSVLIYLFGNINQFQRNFVVSKTGLIDFRKNNQINLSNSQVLKQSYSNTNSIAESQVLVQNIHPCHNFKFDFLGCRRRCIQRELLFVLLARNELLTKF